MFFSHLSTASTRSRSEVSSTCRTRACWVPQSRTSPSSCTRRTDWTLWGITSVRQAKQKKKFIHVTNRFTSASTDPGGRVSGREHQVQQRSHVLLRGPVRLLRAGLCLCTQSVPGRLQAAWRGPEDRQADGEVCCPIPRVQPGVRPTLDSCWNIRTYL